MQQKPIQHLTSPLGAAADSAQYCEAIFIMDVDKEKNSCLNLNSSCEDVYKGRETPPTLCKLFPNVQKVPPKFCQAISMECSPVLLS